MSGTAQPASHERIATRAVVSGRQQSHAEPQKQDPPTGRVAVLRFARSTHVARRDDTYAKDDEQH
jgi:hypothetical protein